MLTDVRLCPDCGDERAFAQPPCADGHDADCPEWACVECGLAVWVGLPERAAGPRRGLPSAA